MLYKEVNTLNASVSSDYASPLQKLLQNFKVTSVDKLGKMAATNIYSS